MADRVPDSPATDDAAPGPHHPVGSPRGDFRPDPQIGQQSPNRTGTFKEVRRSWMSSDDDAQISCYMAMEGRVSVAALLDHLREVAPGRTAEEIGINFATVTWIDTPTGAEAQARVQRQALHDERHAHWERETYERLKAKFEPADS